MAGEGTAVETLDELIRRLEAARTLVGKDVPVRVYRVFTYDSEQEGVVCALRAHDDGVQILFWGR